MVQKTLKILQALSAHPWPLHISGWSWRKRLNSCGFPSGACLKSGSLAYKHQECQEHLERTSEAVSFLGRYTLWRRDEDPPMSGLEYYQSVNMARLCLKTWFLYFYFYFFWAAPAAYGGSQARGRIRDTAASLHHSHSNTRSKTNLWPTPQLMATLDP